MTNSVESSELEHTGLRGLGTSGRIRFVGFTLVVLAILAMNLAMTPLEVLSAAFVGWFQDAGTHQVHDMVISALIWLAFIGPVVLLLYRPTTRVNTVLVPALTAIPIAIMAFLAETFLATGFAIMSVLALGAIALHPAGRSLARLDRVDGVDRRLGVLYLIGAVPLVVLAGFELSRQFGPVDEHVLFVHFGGMAVAALLVVLLGALAVVRERDWRFATWFAGLMAAFVGLASVVHPGVESSLGPIGGAALFAWAALFVAGVEYVRRDSVVGDETAGERDVAAE